MGEMGAWRSTSARWYQAGFVGGGAIGGAAISWTYQHISRPAAGSIAAALLALPAVLYWWLPGGGPSPQPWSALFSLWRKLPGVVAGLVRQPFARIGILILLLPLNVGAAADAFSIMAGSYHASGAIPFVNGLFGGVMTASGALASTFLFHATSVLGAYAAAGFFLGLVALGMGLSPVVPIIYIAGCLAYLFFFGVGSAVTTALILEIQNGFGEMRGTIYAICCSAGNVPYIYSQWLNGLGFRSGGNRGLLLTDAALNAVGVALSCALIANANQRAIAVGRSGAG
jgi:hypothetical protein